MLIGLDSRALARPDVRGIGRYLWHLLEAMRTVAGDVRWRLFYDAEGPSPRMPPGCPAELAPLRCRGDRWRLWEQVALPLSAAAKGVDVLHAPANFAPAVQLSPTVVTLHDTIPWELPGSVAAGRRFLFEVLPKALRRCRRIITISRHSMRSIVRRFPFTRRKTRVIPHGLDEQFLREPDREEIELLRARLGLSRPYVLYVGGAGGRKRADWAVRLLDQWVRRPAGKDLLLGMLGFACQSADEPMARARELGVADRVRVLPYLPAEELPALYAGSELVVYPSLYEGFGFPALEAQAAGKVVLMGRTSSLVELAGPGAELLDCDNFEAWCQTGQRWLDRPAGRAERCEPARRWARSFSWPRAAAETLAVYREAAGEA